MFNIMLDEKPKDWCGFPVNTDFRIGVQINLLIRDAELSEREKYGLICQLLFSGIMPDVKYIGEAIRWYLDGWYTDKRIKNNVKEIVDVDYNVDQWRIYSAFKSQYGIDVNTADLHYWEFMGLLNTLEECAFTRVIDVRNKKISGKMSPEERKAWMESKQIYDLEDYAPTQATIASKEAEQEAIARFMEYANGKEGNNGNV